MMEHGHAAGWDWRSVAPRWMASGGRGFRMSHKASLGRAESTRGDAAGAPRAACLARRRSHHPSTRRGLTHARPPGVADRPDVEREPTPHVVAVEVLHVHAHAGADVQGDEVARGVDEVRPLGPQGGAADGGLHVLADPAEEQRAARAAWRVVLPRAHLRPPGLPSVAHRGVEAVHVERGRAHGIRVPAGAGVARHPVGELDRVEHRHELVVLPHRVVRHRLAGSTRDETVTVDLHRQLPRVGELHGRRAAPRRPGGPDRRCSARPGRGAARRRRAAPRGRRPVPGGRAPCARARAAGVGAGRR